jgi:hypothetical protein
MYVYKCHSYYGNGFVFVPSVVCLRGFNQRVFQQTMLYIFFLILHLVDDEYPSLIDLAKLCGVFDGDQRYIASLS